jgi:hypothetical protein
MDIHNISEVNNPNIQLSDIDRPATGADFADSAQHVAGKGESSQWHSGPNTDKG